VCLCVCVWTVRRQSASVACVWPAVSSVSAPALLTGHQRCWLDTSAADCTPALLTAHQRCWLDTSVILFKHVHFNGQHELSNVGPRAVDIYIQWAKSCLIARFLKLSSGRREINCIIIVLDVSVGQWGVHWCQDCGEERLLVLCCVWRAETRHWRKEG
jgi:hypothetical protein